MPKTDRKFVWGRIIAEYDIGQPPEGSDDPPYQIIEYHPCLDSNVRPRKYAEHTEFHVYVDGKDTNRGSKTLEGAMLIAISQRGLSRNETGLSVLARALGLKEEMPITSETLASIRVLYRQPDTMALWGIPYDMRPGQAPLDLWRSRTIPDTAKLTIGWFGSTLSSPGPREDWIWLGSPGWYRHMTKEEQGLVKAWLPTLEDIPSGPCEWCKVVLKERCPSGYTMPAHQLKLCNCQQ